MLHVSVVGGGAGPMEGAGSVGEGYPEGRGAGPGGNEAKGGSV